MSLREKLLAKKCKTVEVEAFGETLTLKEMDGATFKSFLEEQLSNDANGHALLVVYHVVDEAGNFVFTKEDIEDLVKLPSYELRMVADAAARLSRLGHKPDSKNS